MLLQVDGIKGLNRKVSDEIVLSLIKKNSKVGVVKSDQRIPLETSKP